MNLDEPTDTTALLSRMMRAGGVDPCVIAAAAMAASTEPVGPIIGTAYGPCAGLLPAELGCDGRMHLRPDPRAACRTLNAPCPLVKVRAECQRLRLLLEQARATLDPAADAVHLQIIQGFDITRPIDVYYPPSAIKHGIAGLRRFFADLADGSRPFDRHILLHGRPGNGKSTLCFAAYFGALLRGMAAEWIDTQELLEQERLRRSRNEAKQHEGGNYFARLKRAHLIFCSDLGLRAPDTNDFPRCADLLWEVSEAAVATWICNSNHGPDELYRHNDVGARVMSRLLGNRKDVPAVVIKTDGPDQRKHR